jgi:hypothetical protein
MEFTKELVGKAHGLWNPNDFHHGENHLTLEAYITLLGHGITPKGEFTLCILYFGSCKVKLMRSTSLKLECGQTYVDNLF